MGAIILRVVLVSLAAVTSTLAGEKERTPPAFGAQTSLVSVPVFVSGKDGRVRRGLSIEDFRVEEDGRAVEIVSVQFVDATVEDREDEGTARFASAARRKFLLLFDKSFATPSGLARAGKDATEFVLRDLARSDLVAVATFDVLRGIRLVSSFTEDRHVTEHAIYALGTTSLAPVSDGSISAGEEGGGAQHAYRAEVTALLSNLELLGPSLQEIEGRKQIVFFSDGFRSSALTSPNESDRAALYAALGAGRPWQVESDVSFGDSGMRASLRRVTERISRADAVVHTMSLGGAGGASLSLIAADTGGRFGRDSSDLRRSLREIADLSSRYYVLGVQPGPPRPAGSFRKLKVRVKTGGLRISHRPGFVEPSIGGAAGPVPELQRQFQASELTVGANSPGARNEGLPFGVLLLPVPADGEKQSLGFVVQIPERSLLGGGPVELLGYAVAPSGEVVGHFGHFMRLAPSSPDGVKAGGRGGLSFAGRFEIPAGVYSLRFLVQRPATGETGRRILEVTVPERDPSRGFLLPPVFLGSSAGWAEVPLRNGDLSGLPLEAPLGGDPAWMPRAEVRVQAGRRERILLIAFSPDGGGDPETDLDIRSTLSDESGRNVPLGAVTVDKVSRHGDRRSYLLSFEPQDVPPGPYTLRIRLATGGSIVQSHCRLTVLPLL